jgi:hypothetical protein
MTAPFNDTRNYLHRVIGKQFKDIEVGAKQNPDTGVVQITIQADCRGCAARVMSRITNDQPGWSSQVTEALISVAEEHAQSHQIIIRAH